MNIEIKIVSGDEILLSPRRKDKTQHPVVYQLVDDYDEVWMEVQLQNNSLSVQTQKPEVIEDEERLSAKLDKLVLEIIEAEQSGTENTETKVFEEASPYDPDHIKVLPKQFNVKLIEQMIDNADIDFTPDFQRNFVWNNVQKSRLIESILLRIPLPMFYFSEDDEGKISVVDGLQRLTTIKDFMDNKFPLKNLEYLKDSCEGKYYSSKDKNGQPNGKPAIDPKYFRWFNMTQFSVNVIDPASPVKVKYDIFRRINTGGAPLNNQEIRNCLAGKALRQVLKEMTSLAEFKTATDGSIKATRMDDQEVALRFILFHRLRAKNETLANYNGYMDSSLDDLTEELSKAKYEDLSDYVKLFSNAMKNAEHLLGRRHAFRKVMLSDIQPGAYKQLINKALFVCWSVLLSDYNPERIVKNNESLTLLRPLARRIDESAGLWNALSSGTNSKANLLHVFEESKKLIFDNLNL